MSKPDETFQNYLEGIREELNAYIEAHQPKTFYRLAAPVPRRAPTEKKKVRVQEECSPALYSGKGDKEWSNLDKFLASKEESFSKMSKMHVKGERKEELGVIVLQLVLK